MAKIIDISEIDFRYGQHHPLVLKIDSMQIEQGSRIFVRGPSGSGKTTLLGLVGGVLLPQKGKISILGQDLSKLSGASRDQFRADHIGYIFQMFNLIPYLSVLQNVLLPLSFSKLRRKRLKDKNLNAEDRAEKLLTELGIDVEEFADRPVTQLSVGQQQRVAAARALLGDPEIIIADEPTSALDADNRAGFIKLLIEECHRNGSTLLFVSHDGSLASSFSEQLSLPDINQAAALR